MSGACLLDRRGNRSFGGCHYIAHVCIRDLYGFLFREIHSVENVEIGGIDLHGRQMPVVGIVGGEKQTVRPEGAQNFFGLCDAEGADIVGQDRGHIHEARNVQQLFPLGSARVRNDQPQAGIAFQNSSNALCSADILCGIGIGMDGDGNVPLLRQRENGGVILVIQRAPRIIGVDLDAVQTVAVQCFSDRLRRCAGVLRVSMSAKA